MRLNSCYPIIVTERGAECREFYQRWFGLEVVFEASWFVLLGPGDGSATVAFMSPQHPSAPPGPETFSGKGMCLEFQVDDAKLEYQRFVDGGAPLVLTLRDEPFGQRRFGLSIRRAFGSISSSRSSRKPAFGSVTRLRRASRNGRRGLW